MRQWPNDMLRGHPGSRATMWEQWGNSFVTQFKGGVNTMSHSLRIKEDSYINRFTEKEKAMSDAKETLKKAQKLHDDAKAVNKKYSEASDANCNLNTEVKFLKEKLSVSSQKLNKERGKH